MHPTTTQELTSFNVADDIRDSLDLSNLFDFGTGDGPSLSDELAAAAAINGSSFDYGALAFNASDIGYDLSELTANMTARENSLAPAGVFFFGGGGGNRVCGGSLWCLG